ncbi:hypothetical protein HDU91_002562 [Kappamyces sp. JEL0680]|nr:hypothetical protein HDU91_002562 [Kappamyces sp. JEL0680]
MSSVLDNLKTEPILFYSGLLTVLGALLNLIGTAMLGGGGLTWWYFVFYLLVTIAVLGVVAMGKLPEYKLLLLILVTLALSYLPSDISSAIAVSSYSTSFSSSFGTYYTTTSSGAGVRAAGLIISVMAFFVMLVPLTTSIGDFSAFTVKPEPPKHTAADPAIVTMTPEREQV